MSEQASPFFGIQRVYLKGSSLELPQGAQVFLEQNPPQMELNLTIGSSVLSEGVYEVVLRGTLTGKVGDKTQFLLEIDQAGIFEARDIPEGQLGPILEVTCPTILTPYLRAQISDTLARATLSAFFLPEINWLALHQQRVTEQQQALENTADHGGSARIPQTVH